MKKINIEEIQKYVQQNMSPYRFKHTMGVVQVAKELAPIYGIDLSSAAVAALLHDLAKEIPGANKEILCKEYHICLDECMAKNINLTHGMIGACMVEERLHIHDEDILNAIKNHTLGREKMSILEKIIYLSDLIEPTRTTYPGLEKLRELTYQDLDQAMVYALNSTVDHLNGRGKEVHPLIYSVLGYYRMKLNSH